MSKSVELTRSRNAADHVAVAERHCSRIDDMLREATTRSITSIGVIGAGTMGSGIALAFLTAGLEVVLNDTAEPALERGREHIRTLLQRQVSKELLSAGVADAAIRRLTPTVDFQRLADCDLIIEAVYEDIDLKRAIFRRLDKVMRPGAILATNTSYLDVDAIAAVTSRPGDVAGLHFFSPAHVMKLVEVVRGAATAPDVLATLVDLALRIGKIPVVARVCHGFIGNRMLAVRRRNAEAMLLEGARPEQIDDVLTTFGMPMGPFRVSDLAGIDLGWHRDPTRIDTIREALCAQGRLGQKVGAGFYDYDAQGKAVPSPITQAIVERFRTEHGIKPRAITGEEVTVRTLYAMVNEGLKILDEGVAQRASDIDVVWLHGYGWPRETGGPMFWAETVGLRRIARQLEKYLERLGPDFVLAGPLAQQEYLDA